MKLCTKCKREKPRSHYHKDKTKSDGLCTRCKKCEKTYRREAKLEYLRKYNASRSRSERKTIQEQRSKILNLLGDKCNHCGFTDKRALQVDHIKGGGRQEKKTIKGRYNLFLLRKIESGSKDYQLLCANCNWIKRFTNNEVMIVDVSTDIKSRGDVSTT